MKTKKAKIGTFAEFAKGKTGAVASKAEMARLKNQYMKKISGAVMSEDEVKKLKNTMPKLTRKSGSPKKGEKKKEFKDNPEDRFGEYRVQEAKSGKMMKKLKGGGAAIRGTNFKGVF